VFETVKLGEPVIRVQRSDSSLNCGKIRG
jgi:hypothetical protein